MDPADIVADEQHLLVPLSVVIATQDPVVTTDPVALQPTVGVVRIVQDDKIPEVTHEDVVIIAVEAVQEPLPLVALGPVFVPVPFPEGSVPGGQSPNLIPNISKQGIPGILISQAGGLGKSPPGGGPGTTPQIAIGGRPKPVGMIIGITVPLEEPGLVVVIH